MGQPYYPPPNFRADLDAEQIVHRRIESCLDAFDSGQLIRMKFSVLSLENCLMSSAVINEDIVLDLQELENGWETRYKNKIEIFEKKSIGAVAPGLMKRKKPKHEPDFQHWRMKFARLIQICEDKKMWFKISEKVIY